MQFLSYLVNGISLGSIYAVIALGYTMVYGIARMLNFAHGDVIMVGGYVAFVMMTSLGLPALAAICAAVVVCTLLGIIESLSKAYISSQMADAIVFGVLIIVLLVRPAGILGKQTREKV